MERDSDIADIVLANDCGWHTNDENGLACIFSILVDRNTDLKQKGNNGKILYSGRYSKDLVVGRFDKMFTCIERPVPGDN
tara:strand:+ start:189 stop:428 length:240 start_codon:yes stop_codon:yes gene_type:complete